MLSKAIERGENNYDLLRLILASLVIFSHAFKIQPSGLGSDPLSTILPFGDGGDLAVNVFFVLSGIFVVDSLLCHQSIAYYCLMRVLRVFPGLFVCLILTAGIVGPIFTTLSLKEYFLNPDSIHYIYRNFFLTNLQWRLPGVFSKSQYGINGSLWTLPVEVRLYAAAAAIYVIGSLSKRSTATIAIILTVILSLIFSAPIDGSVFRLIVFFSLGALFAVHKDVLPISPLVAVLFAVAAIAMAAIHHGAMAFYAATAYALLYMFSLTVARRVQLQGDYSYGVYIYGFPVGEVFAHLFPSATALENAATSLLVCWLLGALSWNLIERPALNLGRKLYILSSTRNWPELKGPVIVCFVCLFGALAPLSVMALHGYDNLAPVASNLSIIAFGPNGVEHGLAFNVQPDGSSAIWVKGSRGVTPMARLSLGHTRLDAVVSGNLVTAVVPARLFRSPGSLELRIVEDREGRPSPSQSVQWDVR